VTHPRKVPAGRGAVNDIGRPAPGRTMARRISRAVRTGAG